MPDKQCCGNCKYFIDAKLVMKKITGNCNCKKYPDSIDVEHTFAMYDTEGTDCPCWEQKESE